MDIKRLIKEAHQNEVDRGFYSCQQCGGEGRIDSEPLEGVGREIQMTKECPSCGGQKIDPNKNIGELLMLIVSELGKALDAHRKGRFAFRGNTSVTIESIIVHLRSTDKVTLHTGIYEFRNIVKDTHEDKIATAFIRLFDLCGYLGIEPDKEILTSKPPIKENIGECLLKLSYEISSMWCSGCHNPQWVDSKNYAFIFAYLREFCQFHNIPIEKHIEAKMAYNKARNNK